MYFLQLVSEASETSMFRIYLLYQKQFVSERQKFVQIYVLQTASEASEIFLLFFFRQPVTFKFIFLFLTRRNFF